MFKSQDILRSFTVYRSSKVASLKRSRRGVLMRRNIRLDRFRQSMPIFCNRFIESYELEQILFVI